MYHDKRKAMKRESYNYGTYYSKYQKGGDYLDQYLSREYNQLLINIQDALQIMYTGTNDINVVRCMKDLLDDKFGTLINMSRYLDAERCNEWSSMLQRMNESINHCLDSYIDYTIDFKSEDE